MAMGCFDDFIHLVSNSFEVFLTGVVRCGHPLGNIKSCMVSVIKGRFGSRFEEQSARNLLEAIFFFEVFEVCAIAHGAACQYMACVSVPHGVVEDSVDILWGTAKRKDSVFIGIEPNGVLSRFVNGSHCCDEQSAGYRNTVVALYLHIFDLFYSVNQFRKFSALERC